jgi:hypothetical protein
LKSTVQLEDKTQASANCASENQEEIRQQKKKSERKISRVAGALSMAPPKNISDDANVLMDWEPPKAQGLYDPQNEHEACGVGFIVAIDGKRNHKVGEASDLPSLVQQVASLTDNFPSPTLFTFAPLSRHRVLSSHSPSDRYLNDFRCQFA